MGVVLRAGLVAALLTVAGPASAADPTPTPAPFYPDPTPTPSPIPLGPAPGMPAGFDDAIDLPGQPTPAPVITATPTPVATPVPLIHSQLPQQPEKPWPLQFTLSGGVIAGDDRRPGVPNGIGFGAVWLGTVVSLPGQARRSAPFLGPGVEGTANGPNGPYQWSAGAGVRMGYAWRGGLDAPISDAYVYWRVTPFFGMRRISDPGYLHSDEPALAESGRGVRVGVGFVAPIWTAIMMGGIRDSDGQMTNVSSPDEAIFCVLLGAVVLFTNHVELTWEVYDMPGIDPETLIGIRLGAGF